MLLEARLPVAVGALLMGSLMWALYLIAPMPAELANPHAQLHETARPQGCTQCHHRDGLTTGCLSCHEEIEAQLEERHGYHFFLSDDGRMDCSQCHMEHHGNEFPLINAISWGAEREETFAHAHVDYQLVASHAELECNECHVEQRDGPFTLPAFPDHQRSRTFLGLTQTCGGCHDDPHAGGLASSCGECHRQDDFHPPFFAHDPHFPLVGPHDEQECTSCHEMPGPDAPRREHPFPFDQARGTLCQHCHETPHRVTFDETCDACHAVAEPLWVTAVSHMTPQRHQATGFHLAAPHQDVACQQCHDAALPFAERHSDPAAPGYERRQDTCQGCHEDVHAGQFLPRYTQCVDCHLMESFRPTNFSHALHAQKFPLTGAHEALACTTCHDRPAPEAVRAFAGTPHACKACHADPHAGQFAARLQDGDCTACHRAAADTFLQRPFDHARKTGVELKGAHRNADCRGCHIEVPFEVQGAVVMARRYPGTPQDCAACHKDVHQGQFADYESCTTCHISQSSWAQIQFDHNTQSQFPLVGAHVEVACSACHQPVEGRNGSAVVLYKPLGQRCSDCHEADPRPAAR